MTKKYIALSPHNSAFLAVPRWKQLDLEDSVNFPSCRRKKKEKKAKNTLMLITIRQLNNFWLVFVFKHFPQLKTLSGKKKYILLHGKIMFAHGDKDG